MKVNRLITISLLVIVFIIAGVVIVDHLSTRTDNRPANPFAYNIDAFKMTDDSLIGYREVRQIRVPQSQPRDFVWRNGHIHLLTSDFYQKITATGQEGERFLVPPNPLCLQVSDDGTIFIGYENHIIAFSASGEELTRTAVINEKSLLSSLAVSSDWLFAADAGTKSVRVFDHHLESNGEFKGESGASDIHGFILPGLQFHLAVNKSGELWITNPGIHAIQNYSESGRLRGYWRKASFGPDGFSGCCNPSYFAFLSDDSFVTSEKGIIRVKVHHPSGDFITMVAPADRFKDGTLAPALAVDDHDNILVLDFDRQLIRFFELR